MSSKRAPDNHSGLKPVQKIELSERHIKLRIVLVVLFIVIALAAFAVGIIFYLSTDAGWRQVEASASDTNCSSEFVFFYEIQEGGLNGTSEYRAVASRYGEATVNAYRIFNEQEQFEGAYNLAYVNAHINEEVQVDGALYSAFELLESYGSRILYLAPAYSYYYNIFYAFSELDAALFDPYRNEEAAEYIAQIAAFANDGESIDIELLGDNTVRLNVSEEYEEFAEENEIDIFLDFFMLKNAFIIDYISDYMVEGGFTEGILSSFDGYTRNIGGQQSYNIDVFDKSDEYVYVAGSVSGVGPVSAVRFRNYTTGSSDYGYKYAFSDGFVATNYVDAADGLYKSCINDLISYSSDMSCAELMLNVLPVYVAQSFEKSAIAQLRTEKSIYSVYCDGTEVVYNDSDLTVNTSSYEDRVYTKRYSG